MFAKLLFLAFFLLCYLNLSGSSSKIAEIYGPGLKPDEIIMPARYFFVEVYASNKSELLPEEVDSVSLEGINSNNKPCRIWTNILERNDGLKIVRYKVYETCHNFKITVKFIDQTLPDSVYNIAKPVYPDECDCAQYESEHFLNIWKCGPVPKQIQRDLHPFPDINYDQLRGKIIEMYNQPHSVSLCHYVTKENQIHRRCYGEYVGFKMFMDNILLSLSRKYKLPDLEFFVNLGDWPLVKTDPVPVLSWCGSESTFDIVMPTYDITESTLENMGRVMLDMLSVQGNTPEKWSQRIPKVFWRGRDSNQHRLDLIDLSREHPDLFNVSLTNFFFFRDKQDVYGPKAEHVSFFDFFKYKYQMGMDGTVAAYRFPYLLAGGSLVIKQDSDYYEHFYKQLIPHHHYVPMHRNLSNLVQILRNAQENDEESRRLGEEGRKFANTHLLPQNIYCYHAHLLNELKKRISSPVRVLENMEMLQSDKKQADFCTGCKSVWKDEL